MKGPDPLKYISKCTIPTLCLYFLYLLRLICTHLHLYILQQSCMCTSLVPMKSPCFLEWFKGLRRTFCEDDCGKRRLGKNV